MTTSVLIGHTIFLASEKLFNQRPRTYFSQGKKIMVFASHFWKLLASLNIDFWKNKALVSARFARISSVEEFIDGQENESTGKKRPNRM